MMNSVESLDSIPLDLLIEILSRLPAKSISRFRCLSKLWGSMLRRPYFTELFLTRSSARPRLLFALRGSGEWSIYSTPQPHNPHGKSSLVVTADFHMKFRREMCRDVCSYASGLIYFPHIWISKEAEDAVAVICNPITGQYVSLPELVKYRKPRSFLGFDPIEKQFKVLVETYPFCSERDHHKILTLGTGELRWREIHCPPYKPSLCEGICINGVIYYLAENVGGWVIVCFDVRSEKFKFIDAEFLSDQDRTKLINYKGKLGGIYLEYAGDTVELCLWVLEDVEKQEWLLYIYTLGKNVVIDPLSYFIVGVTTTGEIVVSMNYTSKPFYVFYFNPERNTLQSVEIQGFENHGYVYAFLDQVEDLNANDATQLKLGPKYQ